MKGLEPFRTWDETYVHTKHNEKDRTSSRPRDDQTGWSPGPGPARRARGASSTPPGATTPRTWGHPGFQDLVERGIRWAANKGDVFDSPARAWRRA